MLKKKNLLFLSLLILGILLLSSCFSNPPVTEGIIKGNVLVPEGTILSKDLTGQALPDATVNIINLETGAIIATATTDANGYYQISVDAGGPYLLEAVKDEVKVQQITPPVEVGIEYDLGTADCNTTAVALIVQAMLDAEDYPNNPADINLADIETEPDFDDVSSIVCDTTQAGGDPAVSALVQQAVEDFLYPPAPAPAPTTTPTPAPTYTVTFNSQGGSEVSEITGIAYNATITLPTDPTKEGYTFDGWYKDSDCTDDWIFATDKVTANVTLYAQWISSLDYYVSKAGNDGNNGSVLNPWLTIQHALNNTPDGGTIHVADGTYPESIIFPNDKVITLQSVNGALSTIITGNNNYPTVTCSDSPDSTTLDGFTITHTVGETGRGINNWTGTLTITGSTISGNSAPDYGGGIYNNGNITINGGSTISGNSAPDGGGICNWTGTLTINGSSTISDNSATDGGGIYNKDGILTITGSTISTNSATEHGGGIYNGGTLIITGSTISGNSTANGGGIYNHGTLTITGSTISGNSAEYGGGIYNNGILTIIGGTISSNTATDYYGGGIYNEDTLTITDSEISGNSAPDGGGIYHWYGTLTITGSTISGNTATNSDGGGIYNGLGTSTITSSIISSNSAADYGGGICIYDNSSTPSIKTIQNNTISGNTASISGGGIYIESGSPTIGGVDGSDTANFNTVCGNAPDQINPDSFPNNYISDYCIGDTGPAGGWIFYDDEADGINNIVGVRYLEAAPSDQIGPYHAWSNIINVEIGASAQGIVVGTGQANTTAIITQIGHSTSAAMLCDELEVVNNTVTYDDWFLPSKEELNLMYANLHKVTTPVGGFAYDNYWSSSEVNADFAWGKGFSVGFSFDYYKNVSYRVRAVRAF